MTMNFDLILLPLARHGGQDQPALPGLRMAVPPRRAARGRSLERLIILLTLAGNAPLSPSGTEKLVTHLEQLYYQTPGSSTAAMRSIAEWLNDYLLKRNQNAVSRGMHAAGLLTLAVVRSDRLYIAQSGPGHAYLMTAKNVQHFHRPDAEDRGLGIGRATYQHYFTADFSLGDKLVISPNPPAAWTSPVLSEMRNLEMGEIHQRLIRRAGDTLNAVLVIAEPGKGSARILRPRLSGGLDDDASVGVTQSKISSVPTLTSLPVQEKSPDVFRGKPVSSGADSSLTQTATVPVSDPPLGQPSPKPERGRRSSSIVPGIVAFGRALGVTLQQARQSSAIFLRRILPDERLFSLPTTTMAFIAIAVPLIVTAVAAGVYFQRGQGRLYAGYLLDAQGATAQAQQFEKESEQHIAWNAVIGYLDLAEIYRVTEESQALRRYAIAALDTLDRVTRIEFTPAVIVDLPVSVKIIRIIPTRENDLYLLNGSDSTVLRVVSTGQGFRLDTTFRCGPVPTLSGLIDIVAAPPNDQGVAVMGIDGAGNILQCIPGGKEPLNFPVPLADHHEPRAFFIDIDNEDMYLLTANEVWIYDGGEGYRTFPSAFFGDQVPATMEDIVDFNVKDGKLYLLHNDGSLTTYQRDQDALSDPDLYHNLPRTEEGVVTVEGAVFADMQGAAHPDSSLYFLDASAHSIYRFNSQLVYQQQYQPQNALPDGSITAFAASPGHQFFIAIGHQIYYAMIP